MGEAQRQLRPEPEPASRHRGRGRGSETQDRTRCVLHRFGRLQCGALDAQLAGAACTDGNCRQAVTTVSVPAMVRRARFPGFARADAQLAVGVGQRECAVAESDIAVLHRDIAHLLCTQVDGISRGQVEARLVVHAGDAPPGAQLAAALQSPPLGLAHCGGCWVARAMPLAPLSSP